MTSRPKYYKDDRAKAIARASRSYQRNRPARKAYLADYYATHRLPLLLRAIKHRARKKGVPFKLTLADITVPEFCPVLGIRFEHGSRDSRPEFDRIIPEIGYVPGNVRIISGRCQPP